MDKSLGSVRAAQERLKVARAGVEARLRVMLEAELRELIRARDLSVRKAFEGGASKADIKRALGTKDHATVQSILSGGVLVGVAETEQVVLVSPGECVLNWVEWGGELVADPMRCVFGRNDGVDAGVWFEPGDGEVSRIFELLEESLGRGDTGLYEYVCEVIASVA